MKEGIMPRQNNTKPKQPKGQLIQFSKLREQRELTRADVVCTVYVCQGEGDKGDTLLCERADGSYTFASCCGVEGEPGERQFMLSANYKGVAGIIGKVVAVIEN
jgi:hypothetical protein